MKGNLMMMLTSLLAHVALASSSGWSRGSYGKLAFAADHASYSWSYGAKTLHSFAGLLSNMTGITTSSASAGLGTYDELELHFGEPSSSTYDGSLAVMYFARIDAFVFERRPKTLHLPALWPALSIAGTGTNATPSTLDTRCLGWSEHYFFPGELQPRMAHTHPGPYDLRQCGSGGPLFVFGVGAESGHAFALSPINNFTTQSVYNGPPAAAAAAQAQAQTPPPAAPKPLPPVDDFALGVRAGTGSCGSRCMLFRSSVALLARPGLTRAIRAFGSVLRQHHNTTRSRGPGVTQLSYWNDNQAAYSWWTVGPDQEVWGKPEDIYLKLKEGYDRHNVPIRSWEPDNNWLVTYNDGKDGNDWGNGSGVEKNWIGRQWDYNTELYPSGGDFVSKLGNLSMTYYTNGFNAENAYRHTYAMTKNNEPHPNASFRMYGDLIRNATKKYNMEMLFTDFLCYRGPAMGQYQDVPALEEGQHMWIGGQANAAGSCGVEVQWCMALASQILMSVEFGAVTNARVNGDGGLDVANGLLPALLASTVGLGWSKDNLRTADRCYDAGLYPNGTVKWPCGSINQGEGTSGKYTMQTQQTILATLSLGPVGISDQLSSRPDNSSADVTSNIPLVLATCAATGDLLQPSYPLVPLDRTVAAHNGDVPAEKDMEGLSLWGTYTAVPSSAAEGVAAAGDVGATGAAGAAGAAGAGADADAAAASPGLWYTAFAFVLGKPSSKSPSLIILETDLAPMVDETSLPSPSFSDVPLAPFTGAGESFPAVTPGGHVVWRGDFLAQRTQGCAAVDVSQWTGSHNVNITGEGVLLNIAPVIDGGIALLGEAGKVTAVSTYRFASVHPVAGGGGVAVSIRGKPGEVVTLLFATGGGRVADGGSMACKSVDVTVGKDGAGAVNFKA